MKSDRGVPVAIVGGGFSGTILAAQLARRSIQSVLIDASGRVGQGIAYSTDEGEHLLNVRAEAMSAWAGDPNHFAERYESEGGDRRGFAQRRLYGRYMGDIARKAAASGHMRVLHASATGARRDNGSWRVELDDGSVVKADLLVVATGNQNPQELSCVSAISRFIANPWGEPAKRAVEMLARNSGDALLVGTGLTMVDLAVSLDTAGHRGRIVALSRRGQMPRADGDYEPAPIGSGELPPASVRAITRWLRRRAAEVGWRAAIDSLRPHSHQLWQSLSPDEQRRFLRHARPWWDVHRHRIAPQVAATIHRLVAEERLEVIAGSIVAATELENCIAVELRRRGRSNPEKARFAYAFNCTGPLHAMERTSDPLLRSILDAGFARADHLGIGLAVDSNCRAGERLWALGPLTKGRYWEIIAVPDIREQAAQVAKDIEREIHEWVRPTSMAIP